MSLPDHDPSSEKAITITRIGRTGVGIGIDELSYYRWYLDF